MDRPIILFDLDGTLTDSMPGIVRSVRYALEKMGEPELEEGTLVKFVGPPLAQSFQLYCGFSEKKSHEAVQVYREYYREKGIFENEVYEGIEELLKELHQAGRTLIVATSKPEFFARQIMDHYHLDAYFAYIGGSNLDETRVAKDEVIRYVLEEAGIKDVSRAVMIGDRSHDIQGAKKNGMDSIGVLYGYGSRKELEDAGADWIAGDVPALREQLLG